MKYAFVSNDIVVLIQECESDDQASIIGRQYQSTHDISNSDPMPEVGWIQQNGLLIDPTGLAQPTRHISKEKFLARFTDAELVAIESFASGTSPYAMALRVAMRKQQVAEFIDLDYQKTIDGVNSLVSLGLITSERANQILTAPLTDIERFKR